MSDLRKVFVVHGRNLKMRDALFRFLRSIGLYPIEWSHAVKMTGKASPYIGEILDVSFAAAQAIIVLMTPDDEARLQADFVSPHDPSYEINLTGQARPNVLFEAGMAIGRSPERTLIIEVGQLRPFSDIGGRHVIRLNNSPEARKEVVDRLSTAGCQIDTSGADWFREGDFSLEVNSESQSMPEEKVTIVSKQTKIGVCHITYPVIQGLKNLAIQAKINSFLYHQFVLEEESAYRQPAYEDDRTALLQHTSLLLEDTSSSPQEALTTLDNIEYEVTLLTSQFLSLKRESYYGGGAHPVIQSKAFTIELETGHVFSFSELFDSESDYIPVVQNLIETYSEYGGGRKRSVYDFYLKENSVVVFNLFDNHAMHSVEADIPLYKLDPIAQMDGLIRRLIRQENK